jgi:hypothetical protein
MEEAAAVVAWGYRMLAREVESLERSWRLTDFCLRRGCGERWIVSGSREGCRES